jgi:diguanylate cyclase (GGDEF)-like protein
VLLPGAPPESVATIAERLRSSIEALSFEGPQGSVRTTISIGGKTWQHDRLAPNLAFDVLLEEPDQALYHAKSSGRNRAYTDLDVSAKLLPEAEILSA